LVDFIVLYDLKEDLRSQEGEPNVVDLQNSTVAIGKDLVLKGLIVKLVLGQPHIITLCFIESKHGIFINRTKLFI
jgi:hypothetical protein